MKKSLCALALAAADDTSLVFSISKTFRLFP
jgi:hypothetical protein